MNTSITAGDQVETELGVGWVNKIRTGGIYVDIESDTMHRFQLVNGILVLDDPEL